MSVVVYPVSVRVHYIESPYSGQPTSTDNQTLRTVIEENPKLGPWEMGQQLNTIYMTIIEKNLSKVSKLGQWVPNYIIGSQLN